MSLKATFLVLCSILPLSLHAQEEGMSVSQSSGSVWLDSLPLARPASPWEKTRTMWVGIGSADELDTYLGQEKFTGMEMRYGAETMRRKPGSRVVHEVTHQALLTMAGTRGNSHCYLTALYNLHLGLYYTVPLSSNRLQLLVGGLADATIGGAYNTRNSNNPAQARLSLSVDPAVRLKWRFALWNKSMELHYHAAMPLLGLAFSPAYGQSYYEIFSEGNYDNNCVVTSPFTGPQLYHRLTLAFRLGRTTMSIGYLGDVRQMEANSLKYHHYTHALVVGWRY